MLRRLNYRRSSRWLRSVGCKTGWTTCRTSVTFDRWSSI